MGALLFGCAPKTTPTTRSPALAQGASTQDPSALLHAGQAALASKDWSGAARAFALVLQAGPNAKQRAEALEGLALSRRALGDCAGANRALTTLMGLETPKSSDARRQSNLYDRGICYAELQAWTRCSQDLQAALAIDHDPGLARRMELHARAGLALFQLERFDDAQKELEAGLSYYDSVDSEVRERLADPYFVAMSHFYLGAIAHRRFSEISLNLPKSRMARELEQKAQLIGKLQGHYHDAIRVRHVFWVSAAGYQLGSAFASFYDEMMQSPVPPELSPTQRAIFYTELKKKIRPVLLRAVDVYEKNLTAAKKLGYSTPFVEETRARLAHLQHYLVSDMATGPFAPPPLAKNLAAQAQVGESAAEPLFVFTPTPL